MPDWPSAGFKTITLADKDSMPSLTREKIQEYVVFRQSSDRAPNMDLKAILQGQKITESIMALPFASSTESVFFSGMVEATMRKRMPYTFKIRTAKSGEILNSNCECKAGAGVHATCKHVASVLVAIAKFANLGELTIQKSCTDELQGFHRPKRSHTGKHFTKVASVNHKDPRGVKSPR